MLLLQVLSLSMENFSQRVRHGKRKNAQKNIERPEGAVVYYSMDNLRGRLGSTRKTKRGLGCNANSSTTLLEVGKTRMKMRELQRSGGQ